MYQRGNLGLYIGTHYIVLVHVVPAHQVFWYRGVTCGSTYLLFLIKCSYNAV